MKKGHTLVETLVSIAVMGIVILVIVSFFSEGIKDWMSTIKKPVVKAQGTAREAMSGKVGDKRGGMTGEIRSLIGLCNAERGTITFVVSAGERWTDINGDGLFGSNEAIIFDADNNFSYEQGTDTVKIGSPPPEGTPLLDFKLPDKLIRYLKHTDEGGNRYKFDSNESIIDDTNDNNQYDTGEIVLIGSSLLANGTKVVPFGKTITYFLDKANREIKRLENDTQIETVGKNILVDVENNSFGLEFRYFGSGTTGIDEFTSLPLTSTDDKKAVCFIEIRVAADVDNDKKTDFTLKTKVFPRKFGL